MAAQGQKAIIKANVVAIWNLYFLSLAWAESAYIAFVGTLGSYSDIASIMMVNIGLVAVSCFIQRRTPINIYLDIEFVMISWLFVVFSIALTLLLLYGSRADNGIDLTEISSLVFSLISMVYVMATMFKVCHSDRWYKKVMSKLAKT